MKRTMLRSGAAVLAGVSALLVLGLGAVVIMAPVPLHRAPPWLAWLVILVVSLAVGTGAGWVSARLAAARPVRHALALSAVILAAGALFATLPGPGPRFVVWLFAVVLACGAPIGGWIRHRKNRLRGPAA